MSNPQKQKALIRLGLLCSLALSPWLVAGNTNSKTAQSQIVQIPQYVPVTVTQLEPDNGVIPVELKCENAEVSPPSTIKKLSCVLQNNTNKFISAATINVTISLEQGGTTTTDSSFLTFETFVHPDFRDNNKTKPIPPGGTRQIQDVETNHNADAVKGVMVRIDYVEFTDNNTPRGRNRAGSRIIGNIRAGAAKYKEWLAKKYLESGSSINAVKELLEEGVTPDAELSIQNSYEQQGAIIYRNYAREILKTKGDDGLIKYLRQTSMSTNK